MSNNNNHVVFKGEIAAGASADAVKQKLAALFKINIAQADAMLSGKPVYIKKNVDLPTAKKYQAAMPKSGAIANIVASDKQINPKTASQNQKQTTPQVSSGVNLPGSNAKSEVPDTQAPQTAVNLDTNADISAISMAAVGTDVQNQPPAEISAPDVDLSELSLAATGEGELSHSNDVKPLNIDTSGLSLEQ